MAVNSFCYFLFQIGALGEFQKLFDLSSFQMYIIHIYIKETSL